tara:strand:- start:727 stop:840 length:114 start_codon:yes stop_codon:yes gene_type:complete
VGLDSKGNNGLTTYQNGTWKIPFQRLRVKDEGLRIKD